MIWQRARLNDEYRTLTARIYCEYIPYFVYVLYTLSCCDAISKGTGLWVSIFVELFSDSLTDRTQFDLGRVQKKIKDKGYFFCAGSLVHRY